MVTDLKVLVKILRFFIKAHAQIMLSAKFKMSERVCCGFARVFLWETKVTAKENVKKMCDESEFSYKRRILDERFRLYCDHFNEFEKFSMDRGTVHHCREVIFIIHYYSRSCITIIQIYYVISPL